MTGDLVAQYVPPICAGLGLALAGGANLLLLRRSLGVRVLATLAAVGVAVAAAAFADHPGTLPATARLLAAGLLPCLLLAFREVSGFLSAALHRPAVRFGFLTAA